MSTPPQAAANTDGVTAHSNGMNTSGQNEGANSGSESPANSDASSGGRRYSDQILEELPMRFEMPNDRNKWERPLFVVS
jgi:hypothetical protein